MSRPTSLRSRQGLRQPEVVAVLVEQALEPLGQVDDLAAVLLRLELEPDELPCDLGAPCPQLVLVLPRELERLLQQRVRLRQLPEPDEHAPDVGQRLRLVGAACREVRRPLEEVERRRQVAAEERALARGGEPDVARGAAAPPSRR